MLKDNTKINTFTGQGKTSNSHKDVYGKDKTNQPADNR